MYTTPLSTVISSLCLNHHLYADNTQLFFSFCYSDFESSIIHLQNALQQISSWMTANLLTLNFFKTEFLLIGLKQQLAKICLTQPTMLVTLASFLMSTSPCLSRYQLCPNPATHTSVNFTASDHISITKQPPLPPPSCTPSLTTATRFTTTYEILNQNVFNTFKILSHVLLAGPQSLPISTLLSYLYTG